MTSVDGRARAGPDGTADGPTARPSDARAPEASTDDDPARSESDTGTLRRSRPARPDGGEPTLRTPTGAPQVPPDPPVRRPVPPTFPSPGQPPPGVARRDGRHARPDVRGEQMHTPPAGYRPRHAAPDAETERFAAVTTDSPRPPDGAPVEAAGTDGAAGTGTIVDPGSMAAADAPEAVTDSAPLTVAAATPVTPDGVVVWPAHRADPDGRADPDEHADPDVHADRVRVVLAERRVPTRAVRTVAEIEAQTETGELLLGNLLRAQLTLAIRLGLVAVLLLGSLPVLFLVLPALGSVDVAGIRVPWLLVGVAPYPFLVLLGWLYIRAAERNELDFADNVED